MRRIVPWVYFAAALGVIVAGCGPDKARITGRVFDNNQPVAVPAYGTKMVGGVTPGKGGEKFKRFRGEGSPIRCELKPGPNDLSIDLAKPEQ